MMRFDSIENSHVCPRASTSQAQIDIDIDSAYRFYAGKSARSLAQKETPFCQDEVNFCVIGSRLYS
jgi:hypothetical protein